MKQFLVVAFSALLLTAALSAPLGAQPAVPNFFQVTSVQVKLGEQAAYEGAVKKLLAALAKAGGSPVFGSTSTSHPGSYFFVQPLASMGEMDAGNPAVQAALEKNPGLMDAVTKHSESIDVFVIRPRPELGYRPEEPRLADDEMTFYHLSVIYVHREHASQFEDMAKQFAALYKDKGISDGWLVAEAVTGEGPAYYIRNGASSEADFYAQRAKNNAKLGEAVVALLGQTGPMIRRIENRSGVIRPDLSFGPE